MLKRFCGAKDRKNPQSLRHLLCGIQNNFIKMQIKNVIKCKLKNLFQSFFPLTLYKFKRTVSQHKANQINDKKN